MELMNETLFHNLFHDAPRFNLYVFSQAASTEIPMVRTLSLADPICSQCSRSKSCPLVCKYRQSLLLFLMSGKFFRNGQ